VSISWRLYQGLRAFSVAGARNKGTAVAAVGCRVASSKGS
jgi:hypothetical protein